MKESPRIRLAWPKQKSFILTCESFHLNARGTFGGTPASAFLAFRLGVLQMCQSHPSSVALPRSLAYEVLGKSQAKKIV